MLQLLFVLCAEGSQRKAATAAIDTDAPHGFLDRNRIGLAE